VEFGASLFEDIQRLRSFESWSILHASIEVEKRVTVDIIMLERHQQRGDL